MTFPDDVVLVDEDGRPIGVAPKATVHHADTPLHLAFSCHLYNSEGLVLMTRRALGKRTWPGVWTNAFCGHPRPGEEMADAVVRHARGELGVGITDLSAALPAFRYRAVAADGIVENEICPVFTAYTDDALAPDPDEVMETRWADPADVARAVAAAPWAFSPWYALQAQELAGIVRATEFVS